MEAIITKDASEHIAGWWRKVIDNLPDVTMSPLTTSPSDELDVDLVSHLLPTILIEDPSKVVLPSDYSTTRLRNSPALLISHMGQPVGTVFPHRGDEATITQRHWLPLLYRYLEETPNPSDAAFDMERRLSKMITEDVPLGGTRREDRLLDEAKVIGVMGAGIVTGVTAALASLRPDDPPTFPIEIATDDLTATRSKILSIIEPGSSSIGGKVDVRQTGVNHPSGCWYLTINQFYLDKRLVVTVYDSLRYMPYGVSTKKDGMMVTSPYITMMHLCYTAWMMERRGIYRYRWTYSLLRQYRRRIVDETKVVYAMRGHPTEWLDGYPRRSPAL